MTQAMASAAADVAAHGETRGAVIVVVGPSGVGKDSVMGFAARHFAATEKVAFARRVITRPADAGGETHVAVDDETFARMKRDGAFCVSWEAHGLSYGVPVEVREMVGQGSVVVVNGSRQALADFAAVFPRLKVVTITAHAEVRAERLARRGRESGAAIAARLDRQTQITVTGIDAVSIDNSGALEIAGNVFIDLLQAALAGHR